MLDCLNMRRQIVHFQVELVLTRIQGSPGDCAEEDQQGGPAGGTRALPFSAAADSDLRDHVVQSWRVWFLPRQNDGILLVCKWYAV
jgi:hypothetical protein